MNDSLIPDPDTNSKIVKSAQPITLAVVPRHIKMFQLSEGEVDALASGGADYHLAFLGISAGAFIALAIVLVAGGGNAFQHATYVSLEFASAILSVSFAISTYKPKVSHS